MGRDIYHKIPCPRQHELSGAAQSTVLSLDTSIGVLEASNYIETMVKAMEILEEDSRLSATLSRNLGADDALTRFYQQDLLLKIEKVNEEIRGINESIQ